MVPEYNENIQTILAIPLKRSDRNIVEYLSKEEVESIINAPDLSTWSGMRDHVMFMTLYNTGARASEILALKIKDVTFSKSSYIKLKGKGRKERTIPLWKRTTHLIKNWINYLDGDQEFPLFPNAQRRSITRFGLDYRLRLAKQRAENKCPSLTKKKIHAHVFRHTTAMHLLQSGIDINVIALWLGHENPSTTHQYLHADLEMKEKILCLLKPPSVKCIRFQPSDSLLKFLSNL